MKTKINLTNQLAKGSVLVIFAISVMVNISAQNAQDVVYSEKYASTQYIATDNNADNTKKLISVASSSGNNSDAMLESFLLKAAGINSTVTLAETETSELTENNDISGLECFLITAAGLNQSESFNPINNDLDSEKDLENFLIHAASLDSMQNSNVLPVNLENDSQDEGFNEFLLRAAGLNSYTCSNMD
jgi:hypothetical protein